MKISKVDNTHAGIKSGMIGTRTNTGLLYKHPSSSDQRTVYKDSNLDEYVQSRIQKSQELYNAFNPFDDRFEKHMKQTSSSADENSINQSVIDEMKDIGTELGKYYSKIIIISFKKIGGRKKRKRANAVHTIQNRKLEEADFKACFQKISNTKIDDKSNLKKRLETITDTQILLLIEVMSQHYLRKAISRTILGNDGSTDIDFRTVTKNLLHALIMQLSSNQNEAYLQLNEREVLHYLMAFYKDYSKETQAQNLVKSIKNNNIPVQCRKIGEKHLLMLSNASFDNMEGDRSKKAFIFSFIRDYAAINELSARKEKLKDMKRLLILFLYGESTYTACEGVSFEELETILPEGDICFCSEIYNYLYDNGPSKDSSNQLDQKYIKAHLRDCFRNRYQECRSVLSKKYSLDVVGKENWSPEMEKEMGWVSWFEDCIERILQVKKSFPRLQQYKLDNKYLLRKCWSEFMAFICQKYIAIGKAVYHFSLPHNYENRTQADSSRKDAVGIYDLSSLPDVIQKQGITGADYERVKAIETLQRETAAYVASAAGNFIRSVSIQQDMSSDVLMMNKLFDHMDADSLQTAYIRVMRYFGGISLWDGWNPYSQCAGTSHAGMRDYRILLLDQILKSIYAVRNSSFHYAEGITDNIETPSGDSLDIIKSLIEWEASESSKAIREKYYSNNVWMFYEEKNIIQLLNKLYEKESIIPAQVPSFHTIFTKDRLFETFSGWTYSGDTSESDTWKNTVYFLLKECYYKAFLPNSDLVDLMKTVIARMNVDEKSSHKNESSALEHFRGALTVFYDTHANTDWTMGELCQFIMGEYNRQNNEIQKVVSGRKSNGDTDKRIYQHFPMILYKALREAFKEYILKYKDSDDRRNIPFYQFIGNPSPYHGGNERSGQNRSISVDGFCASWKTDIYRELSDPDMVISNPFLFHWFLTAHFLAPVQLNHFKGTLKSFISFLSNIVDRQKASNGTIAAGAVPVDIIGDRKDQCERLLRVLELVSLLNGRTSGKISDYFPSQRDKSSEDIYADFLEHFVDFKDKTGCASYDVLKEFCQKENGQKKQDDQPGKIGLYYDDENPIANRNLIYADMYGNAGTIAECISSLHPFISNNLNKEGKNKNSTKKMKEGTEIPLGKVTYKELVEFYQLQEKLKPVFERGFWETKEELIDQRKYISMKNRVELLDISIYTDIMNDLYIRLVSWCNLWERDQMYLRLGYQYVKLFFTNSISPDSYLRALDIKDGPKFEEGAVLYQIEAVYNYVLPVSIRDNENSTYGRWPESGGNNQKASENLFKTSYCFEEESDKEHVFDGGMEFFDMPKHFRIVKDRRNYIDHLNYYSRQQSGRNYSMMELYAFMYNDMFRYNTNLRKSTTYVFENALMRYRVLPYLKMDLGKNIDSEIISVTSTLDDRAEDSYVPTSGRSVAIFRTSRDNKGLRSDVYTFKQSSLSAKSNDTGKGRNQQYKVCSRSVTFLKQLDELLDFKQQDRI